MRKVSFYILCAEIFLVGGIVLFGCTGGEMPERQSSFKEIESIPKTKKLKIGELKVYFGHRSVGYNIVDGLKNILGTNISGIDMEIVELDDESGVNLGNNDFRSGVFLHSKIGENTKPYSKIDDFEKKVTETYGNKVDVAFFKFCFVDINSKTDVKAVFAHYQEVMAKLKTAYPRTKFVHCTVPLTILKKSIKTTIKEILGKDEIWEYDNLIANNRYNQLLLSHYLGKEPVFDLAQIESTYPDGKQCVFQRRGSTFASLVPEYSHDGGHLNEKGRRIVAEQLLIFLSEQSS